jgi:hypothetical protein
MCPSIDRARCLCETLVVVEVVEPRQAAAHLEHPHAARNAIEDLPPRRGLERVPKDAEDVVDGLPVAVREPRLRRCQPDRCRPTSRCPTSPPRASRERALRPGGVRRRDRGATGVRQAGGVAGTRDRRGIVGPSVGASFAAYRSCRAGPTEELLMVLFKRPGARSEA